MEKLTLSKVVVSSKSIILSTFTDITSQNVIDLLS